MATSKESIGFSIRSMDRSVDPFADFYSYSCGNWLKRKKIPEDKSRIGSFEELYDKNTKTLKSIVTKCSEKATRSPEEQKIGDLYKSLMNTTLLEKLEFKPINPIIKKVRDMASKKELTKLLANLSTIGVSPFFSFHVSPDLMDSSTYAVYLWQGGLGLPDREYYLNEKFAEVRKKYSEFLKKLFLLYGANTGQASKDAEEILRIETKLARFSRSRAELRDDIKNYNKFSYSKLIETYKGLDFETFFKGMGAKRLSYAIVGQPEFFKRLENMLKTESIDSIKAYIAWNVLMVYGHSLHEEIYKLMFGFFNKTLQGQSKPRPRWKRGVSLVNMCVGEALGSIYAKHNFGDKSMHMAESLVSDIRASFRERLKHSKWMTEETKIKALEKLDSINVKIGYPKKPRDYSRLKIDPNDLVGNIMRSISFDFERDIKRIGKKVDKSEWGMTAPTVNAYYDPSMNEIVIPAGILQPPFFDENLDNAVNYAAIGGVIGHELTHGFDDQGSKYDKYGNLKEWWTKNDRRNFEAKAKGVEKLYGSLEIMPGIKVNGKLTLGENIADLGGISIAYDALHKAMEKSGEHKKLIDGFTQEQRFFISWSQLWKNLTKPETQKLLATIDPHSPAKFRGTVPVLTHKDFETNFRKISRLKEPKQKLSKTGVW